MWLLPPHRATARHGTRTRYVRALWTSLFALFGILFVFSGPAQATMAIHVRGNQLVDAQQRPIRLLGVNFSGAEYACIQDRGIWSAPTNQEAVEAIASWHVNVVRIPLNEDCWLGINGAPEAYSGANYQQAIHEFVAALNSAGIYAILDLQWSAPGANQATGLQDMADLDHSPEFWRSVADSFREDPAVLFDLYSEPHEISWECWLEGCTLPWAGGGTWQTAGMQTLIDAVRSQGATQPLLLGGVEWSNDLSGWLAHLPTDPQNQLVASTHVYPNNSCNSAACWSETLAPIAAQHPVVAGEIGEFDCEDHFVDQFMNWADENDVSYLGWTWNTFDCSSGPALISSPDGTPTAFGQGLRDHLRTPRTTLEVTPSPVAAGQPLTLSVQTSSPTWEPQPTGEVTFQVDGENLAVESLDENGQATLLLPRLSVGAHRIRALYGGNDALDASASETQTVEVLPEEVPPTPPILPGEPGLPSPSPLTPPPSAAPFPPTTPAATITSEPPVSRVVSLREPSKSPRHPSHKQCSHASRARAKGAHGRALQARCTPAKRSGARKAARARSLSRNSTSTRER
jgi:endoglucanase